MVKGAIKEFWGTMYVQADIPQIDLGKISVIHLLSSMSKSKVFPKPRYSSIATPSRRRLLTIVRAFSNIKPIFDFRKKNLEFVFKTLENRK